MNRLNKLLITALVAMLLLAACGQTGALYLPETDQTESEEDKTKEE